MCAPCQHVQYLLVGMLAGSLIMAGLGGLLLSVVWGWLGDSLWREL